MALAIETPSRIWRRIKEGEALDDEMPSLPSLPDLDVSGLSDLEPPSLSVVTQTLKTAAGAPENKSTQLPSTPVMPQSNWYPGSGKDVTALPSGMSLYEVTSEAQHEELDEIPMLPAMRYADEEHDLSGSEGDRKTPVPALRIIKRVDTVDRQVQKATTDEKTPQEAYAGQCGPTNRGMASASVSQGPDISGSLPNVSRALLSSRSNTIIN